MAKRQEVLEVIRTRLQAIATANDYQTDAGATIFFGETPLLGDEDPDAAIAMVPGEEQIKIQGNAVFVRLPVDVQALAKADLDQPWVSIEALIADIKTAVEQADRTLGGLLNDYLARVSVRALPREPGSTTIGAAVTYLCAFREQWGNP